MTKNKLIPGKLYNVTLAAGDTYQLYYLGEVEGYDHPCDCCGRDTLNGVIFCEEFYGTFKEDEELYTKSWDSGAYFIGGSGCLKKFVKEIDETV